MNKGKYALRTPVALKRSSNNRWIPSQIAYPLGLMTIHPLTGLCSANQPPR